MKKGDIINMSVDRKSLKPEERLKQLISYSNLVDVDPHVPPQRYYRSGVEMVRMANVYFDEGSLENAYVLYLKFMTLFLEKIRRHPDFNTVSSKMKAINQTKLREILPKAEKLKEKLLEKYTEDYNTYLKEHKMREEPRPSAPPKMSVLPSPFPSISVPTIKAPNIDNVFYPDPDPTSVSAQSVLPSAPSIPSVDRSNKPSMSTILLDSYDKNALRTVIVPTKVIALFLAKAAPNTLKNVETCGILTGKLEKHELKITHLIIPKQKGTPDSCITMSEEEIFDIQDQHNLITIGWIHTHPTQTAFLSSVDLHTQCPYQLLMPEAIAIVCAPKYSETGFFTLSEHGLKYIANCSQSGFHPHPPQPELFIVAQHVKVENSAALEVVDLRTGKTC